jgi:hypothetical protein
MFEFPNAMLRFFRPRLGLVVLIMPLLLGLFFGRWVPHASLSAMTADSSIFLYIGQQVNNGLTPYADVWDHKPPLIFWLNAFALRFTPGSARGIVCLAYVFVLAFLFAAWAALRPRVGTFPTIFALLLVVNLLPEVMVGPNVTEVFSLPLQAISFLLLCRQAEHGSRPYYPILQGLLAAALFQLRPNNAAVIGLYIFLTLFEHIRRREVRRLAVSLAVFFAAFGIGNVAVLWTIIDRGCFRQYWDAAFRFGSKYLTMRPAIMHVYAVSVGLLKISRFGGSVVAGATAAAVVAAQPSWTNVRDRFAMLAVTLFAMEVAGSAVSGRAYEHYFMMWLLPVTLLAGLFIKMCSDAISLRPFAVALFCGACAILLVGSVLDSSREIGETVVKFHDRQANVVQYVRERTTPADRVFVWNGFSDLLFRLGRRPATRFFHFAAMLDVRSYRAQATEALRDVERLSPKFILEYQPTPESLPGIFAATEESVPQPGDSGELRDAAIPTGPDSWDSSELRELKSRLRERYELAYSNGSGVRVFERKQVRGSQPEGAVN